MRRVLCVTGRLAAWVVLGCVLVAPARAGSHPHDRNGFMIGFSVGGGSQGVEDEDEREGSGTGNFRIGYAVQPDLVVAFEGSGWTKTFDTAFGEATWTFSTAAAALTWYPGGQGAFLRGGVGVGTASVEVDTGPFTVSDDESGLGLLGAAGYEWRLTSKFALGPHAEFTWMDLSDEVGSANMFGGGLDFDWYW
jgi:hypothetical protein